MNYENLVFYGLDEGHWLKKLNFSYEHTILKKDEVTVFKL